MKCLQPLRATAALGRYPLFTSVGSFVTDKEGGCSPPPIANIRIRKDYIVPSSGRAPPLVVSFFYPAVNSCGVSRHEDPRWNGGKESGGEKWVDVRDDGLLDYPPSRDFELESLGNQRVVLTRKIVSFRENAGLLSLMNNWSGKRVGLCDPCSRRVSRLLSWLRDFCREREREIDKWIFFWKDERKWTFHPDISNIRRRRNFLKLVSIPSEQILINLCTEECHWKIINLRKGIFLLLEATIRRENLQ